MSIGLRDELMNLKSKLEALEKDLTDQMMELEVKAEKWAKLDEEAENLVKVHQDVVCLDIGGKKFQTKLSTLLSTKDTLFYKLILSQKLDLKQEIFIERNYNYFHVILSFLRNKKVNLNGYKTKELQDIYNEAEFYQVTELLDLVDELSREIKYLSYTSNGEYRSGNTLAGTNNIEHLNDFEDRSMKNGICATSPGWIILELNREVEFSEVEIAGWGGNTSVWAQSNGSGCKIYTSVDKIQWTDVGTHTGGYDRISKIVCRKTTARYVKIQSTTYLGVGYFKIIKSD